MIKCSPEGSYEIPLQKYYEILLKYNFFPHSYQISSVLAGTTKACDNRVVAEKNRASRNIGFQLVLFLHRPMLFCHSQQIESQKCTVGLDSNFEDENH